MDNRTFVGGKCIISDFSVDHCLGSEIWGCFADGDLGHFSKTFGEGHHQ